jgi:hypothetical protein
MKKTFFLLLLCLSPLFSFAQAIAGYSANYSACLKSLSVQEKVEVPIVFEGSSFIKIHFSTLNIANNGRLLLIDDKVKTVVYEQKGEFKAEDVWLPSVDSDQIILQVENGEALIDRVGVGFDNMEESRKERICGNDDRLDPKCYDSSYQDIGAKVGRIMFELYGMFYYCTGFLVSQDSVIVTNEHCIQISDSANSAEIKWKYENSTCGGNDPDFERVSTSFDLVAVDPGLDIAILKPKSDNPSSYYGYLELNDAKVERGDTIWIPQHPFGGVKKFAVHSDSDGGATILEVGQKGVRVGQCIGYNLDVEAGSSGSPVIDKDGKVIAIHSFTAESEGCKDPDLNKGMMMTLLYPVIEPYIVPCNGNPPTITKVKYNVKRRQFKVWGSGFTENSRIMVAGISQSTKLKKDGKLVCAMFDRLLKGDTASIEVFCPETGCRSEKFYFTR